MSAEPSAVVGVAPTTAKFNLVPVCERCWFIRREHPPLRTVKVPEPERCYVCDSPTIAGIFVRIPTGGETEWIPLDLDPHEPTASKEWNNGWEQGRHTGYDDGFGAGYDACLRDNGLGAEPTPLPPPVHNVVDSL